MEEDARTYSLASYLVFPTGLQCLSNPCRHSASKQQVNLSLCREWLKFWIVCVHACGFLEKFMQRSARALAQIRDCVSV